MSASQPQTSSLFLSIKEETQVETVWMVTSWASPPHENVGKTLFLFDKYSHSWLFMLTRPHLVASDRNSNSKWCKQKMDFLRSWNQVVQGVNVNGAGVQVLQEYYFVHLLVPIESESPRSSNFTFSSTAGKEKMRLFHNNSHKVPRPWINPKTIGDDSIQSLEDFDCLRLG